VSIDERADIVDENQQLGYANRALQAIQ